MGSRFSPWHRADLTLWASVNLAPGGASEWASVAREIPVDLPDRDTFILDLRKTAYGYLQSRADENLESQRRDRDDRARSKISRAFDRVESAIDDLHKARGHRDEIAIEGLHNARKGLLNTPRPVKGLSRLDRALQIERTEFAILAPEARSPHRPKARANGILLLTLENRWRTYMGAPARGKAWRQFVDRALKACGCDSPSADIAQRLRTARRQWIKEPLFHNWHEWGFGVPSRSKTK